MLSAKRLMNEETNAKRYLNPKQQTYIDLNQALTNLLFKGIDNQKRGGLNLESFDLSCFKPFTLRFSNKSVRTPSCERPKTTRRRVFLLFEYNNCFQIMV
jgi:hypothetical protein